MGGYNSEEDSNRYVEYFREGLGNPLIGKDPSWREFKTIQVLEYLEEGDLALILDPKKFFTPDLDYWGDFTGERESKDVDGLVNSVAGFVGIAEFSRGSYIGESPYETFLSDYEFNCSDGKKRFMRNHAVGEGYVYLPHPKCLDEFIETIMLIPEDCKLRRNIISGLQDYYKRL